MFFSGMVLFAVINIFIAIMEYHSTAAAQHQEIGYQSTPLSSLSVTNCD